MEEVVLDGTGSRGHAHSRALALEIAGVMGGRFGAGAARGCKRSSAAKKDDDDHWRVGGRYHILKQRREQLAHTVLQHHKRMLDEKEDQCPEGRLKRIEKLVEELLVFSENTEREIKYLHEEIDEDFDAMAAKLKIPKKGVRTQDKGSRRTTMSPG